MEQLDVNKINNLIFLIGKNVKNSLDILFQYTYKNMQIIANHYLINKSDTDDVLSQLYCNVVNYAKTFDKDKNGYNWMFTIVKNLSYKENARYAEFKKNCLVSDEIEDKTFDPLKELLVEEALSVLSEKEKKVLYMCFWEGYTIEEIANKFDVPKSTIYNMRLRIYKKIKPYLIEEKNK